jgi:hypothetical protein
MSGPTVPASAELGAVSCGREASGVRHFAGALAFWVTNLAISLTSVAADHRAALSISYVPMLVEAAIGGIVIALFVSATLAHVPERVPGREPVSKALALCLAVLVVAFNLLGLLALGLVVGFLRLRADQDHDGTG